MSLLIALMDVLAWSLLTITILGVLRLTLWATDEIPWEDRGASMLGWVILMTMCFWSLIYLLLRGIL